MVARNLLALGLLALAAAGTARAQGGRDPTAPQADPQAMQMQMVTQQIMQDRPPGAEAAARSWLQNIAPDLIPGLDSLKAESLDQYWMEVAQLNAQLGLFQNIRSRDSVRAQLVGKMFGLEAYARAEQRAYRAASEANRPAIRAKIEAVITQHFDLEDQLRAREIADIERRLADVRAESQRRRDKRAEFIKFAVDDIVRDAIRPR